MSEAVLTQYGGGDEWDAVLVVAAVLLFKLMMGWW